MLQYGCYRHAVICRLSNCCLSLYLHVAGDYDRVLERLLAFWKVLEFLGARQFEPCLWHRRFCGSFVVLL